jgi:hypothetical protein
VGIYLVFLAVSITIPIRNEIKTQNNHVIKMKIAFGTDKFSVLVSKFVSLSKSTITGILTITKNTE